MSEERGRKFISEPGEMTARLPTSVRDVVVRFRLEPLPEEQQRQAIQAAYEQDRLGYREEELLREAGWLLE